MYRRRGSHDLAAQIGGAERLGLARVPIAESRSLVPRLKSWVILLGPLGSRGCVFSSSLWQASFFCALDTRSSNDSVSTARYGAGVITATNGPSGDETPSIMTSTFNSPSGALTGILTTSW